MIKEVKNFYEYLRFIYLPYRLYKNDKYWIPPIFFERYKNLRKNPFFEHGKAKLFLSINKKVMGRISAHIDYLHIEKYRDSTGFFGFFESENSQEVANELFKAAENFLKSEGIKRIRGPFDFNINGESGILVDGFNHSPYIMMPYTKEYYPALIERYGFKKAKDLYCWKYELSNKISEFTESIHKSIKDNPKIKIRSLSTTKKEFEKDVLICFEIFNNAWSKNWGFLPITESEAKDLAGTLKSVLDSDLAFIVEYEGKPCAMCIAVPNINEIIKDLKGVILPQHIIKFIYRLIIGKRRIKSARLILLGVKEEFRNLPDAKYLPILMFVEMHKRAENRGYKEGELSWTLEDNIKINRGIELMKAYKYKTYRIYEKWID